MRGRTGRVAVALVVLPALLAGGCDRGDDDGLIDRETFVATYIDLRREALESPTGRLDAAGRERVLADNGVTEEELLAFADAHGRDVDYMMELWTEVEERMDSLSRPAGPGDPADSLAPPDGSGLPSAERGGGRESGGA